MADGTLKDRAQIDAKRASISANIANKTPLLNQIKGLRHMPKDEQEQNKLAVELVEWTCSPSSFYIEKFPVSKGISPYRFFKTKHTNDFFAECVELANAICHLNLKEAVHQGDLHYSYVLSMLPVYDGDYKGFMIEKISKKVMEYIKQQQTFACSWLNELKEDSNDESKSRTDRDQSVPAQTIPESIP